MKTLHPSDLGLSVTEHARLREPAEPAYAKITSTVFSRDGKELAVTRVQAALRSQQARFAYPSLEYTRILETFRVGEFARTGILTWPELQERIHVVVAPQSGAEPSGDADPFMLVRAALFAPNEITVASGKSGEVIRSLPFRPRFAFTYEPQPWFPLNGVAVAFSPDGRLLAAAGGAYVNVRNRREVYRGELRCWEIATGKPLFQTEAPDSLRCIAFSPDGRTIAAGHAGAVRFYRTGDGEQFDLHRFLL